MNVQFSLVVVDYKSMEETANFIKNFDECIITDKVYCIVVLDNSVDDSNFDVLLSKFEFIENLSDYKNSYLEIKQAKKFRYGAIDIYALQADENSGYAKGNNISVEYLKNVIQIVPEYYIISNNDVSFVKNYKFDDLVCPFKFNPGIAVVGPNVISENGTRTTPRKKIRVFHQLITYNLNFIFSGIFKKFSETVLPIETSKEVYWVSGCFMVIDALKFLEVGMFDPNTFLYAEEMILAERLAKHNYKMYYNHEISIHHYHGKTTSQHNKTLNTAMFLYDSHRYYAKEYRNASKVLLAMSDFVFSFYKFQFFVKRKIKNFLQSLAIN